MEETGQEILQPCQKEKTRLRAIYFHRQDLQTGEKFSTHTRRCDLVELYHHQILQNAFDVITVLTTQVKVLESLIHWQILLFILMQFPRLWVQVFLRLLKAHIQVSCLAGTTGESRLWVHWWFALQNFNSMKSILNA